MSDMQDLAEALFGSRRLEDSQDDPAATKTVTATALAASDGGTVTVAIGGFGGTSSIEVPTTVDVREGDTVQVTLTGDTVQTPVVTGVVGGGDRMRADVDAKAEQSDLDAANAEIAKKADKEALEAAQASLAAVKSEADAHAEQIGKVQQSVADFKKDAEATYATKTDVDDKTGAITKTLTACYTKTADLADTDAVKDAKKAGTDAQSQLAGYKSTVSETYAEKTELTQAVNELSSTMSSNYSAFTDYRTSNDTALSKAQTAANDAQNTIDNYKTANDQAVADAKSAGTTAQNQLSNYKSSNDAAVAAAKKAGTDAQSNLNSYKTATDKKLGELSNIANNAIESWYLKGAPTTSNPPASTWTNDALKKQHAGDLYMDTDTGYSYRWSGTAWVQVKDSDVTKALNEIQSVKTDYATKSELKSTDEELSGKISDSLTTAKNYTNGQISQEVTNRNAAIKAQADQISLSVSKTYTKADTFAAYQSDADSRIATANSNAATAKSTAQTAASDAATAKTNASNAVSTANGAKSTADAASKNASSAVSTANAASSTANSAKSTAATASANASNAVATANAVSSNLDDYKKTVASTYATQASLKVQSDRITSEVSARAQTDKAVSDLSTRVTQTETGITTEISDRKTAVSNAQTAAVNSANANTSNALKSYTKTADLAATDAVKAAKKAGTDAQATANATATLIRQYEGGVLVCKTGNSVGALVNANGSFDVVVVSWNSGTPTVGATITEYGNNRTVFYGPDGSGKAYMSDGKFSADELEAYSALYLPNYTIRETPNGGFGIYRRK